MTESSGDADIGRHAPRGDPVFAALLAASEAQQREARRVFRASGGERLFGRLSDRSTPAAVQRPG